MSGANPAHRVVAWVASALFALSAAVQWNDPDPAVWIAAYLYAAGLAAASTRWRIPMPVAAGSALAFAAGAATRLSALAGANASSFNAWAMGSGGDEEAREAVGLLLCSAFCAWLAARPRPRA